MSEYYQGYIKNGHQNLYTYDNEYNVVIFDKDRHWHNIVGYIIIRARSKEMQFYLDLHTSNIMAINAC